MHCQYPNLIHTRTQFFFFKFPNPICPEVENTYPLDPGSQAPLKHSPGTNWCPKTPRWCPRHATDTLQTADSCLGVFEGVCCFLYVSGVVSGGNKKMVREKNKPKKEKMKWAEKEGQQFVTPLKDKILPSYLKYIEIPRSTAICPSTLSCILSNIDWYPLLQIVDIIVFGMAQQAIRRLY